MVQSKDLTIQTAKDLPVGSDGLVKFENVSQQLLWADSMIKSGMLPRSYKQPSEVVAAMQMANEVGLRGGITTLRRTANINGTPSMFGELPLAVVQASGKLSGMVTYYFDKSGKKIHPDNGNLHEEKHGFFCQMTRDNGTSYYDFYTIADALKAGLGNVWKKHPEDMLRWRVIAKVIKTLFADIISGAPVAEYDFNTRGDFDSESYDVDMSTTPKADSSFMNEIPDGGIIEEKKLEVQGSPNIEKTKEVEKKSEIEDIPFIEAELKPEEFEMPDIESFEFPVEANEDEINKQLRDISSNMGGNDEPVYETNGLKKEQIDEIADIRKRKIEAVSGIVLVAGEFKGIKIGEVDSKFGEGKLAAKAREVRKWMDGQEPSSVDFSYLKMLAFMERYLELKDIK